MNLREKNIPLHIGTVALVALASAAVGYSSHDSIENLIENFLAQSDSQATVTEESNGNVYDAAKDLEEIFLNNSIEVRVSQDNIFRFYGFKKEVLDGFYKHFFPGDQYGTTLLLSDLIKVYPQTTLIGEPGAYGTDSLDEVNKNPQTASYTPNNRERIGNMYPHREVIDEPGIYTVVDGSAGVVKLYDAQGNLVYALDFSTDSETTAFLLFRTPEGGDGSTPEDLSWQIEVQKKDPRDALALHVMRTQDQEPQQRFSADYMYQQIENAVDQECGDAGCNKVIVVEIDLTTGATQLVQIEKVDGKIVATFSYANFPREDDR